MRKVYLLITAAMLLIGSSSAWATCTTANALVGISNYGDWTYYCSNDDANAAIADEMSYQMSKLPIRVYPGAQITMPAITPDFSSLWPIISQGSNNNVADSILITNNYRYNDKVSIGSFNFATRIDNNGIMSVNTDNKAHLLIKNSATGTFNLNNSAAYNDTRIINNEGIINISSGQYNTGVSITNNGGTINISGESVSCRFSENVSFINNEGTISITVGYFAIPLYDQIREFIAEGYAAYRTTNQYGEWYAIRSLGNNVATVNGIPYENLLTALEYSSEEYPATLITNVSVDFSDYLLHTRYDYLDMNGFNIQATGTIELLEASLTIKNSIPSEGGVISASSANQGSLIALVGAAWDKEESSVLSIGEGVTIKNTTNANYGVSIFGTGDDHNAYGVKVNIAGKVLTENGTALCINGMVQATDGHVPQINIADGAVLGNAGEGCSMAAIYAAGYGIWNIGAATLNAGTPIYAKSGTININGATIAACGEYAVPTPDGNGFHGTGDAIVLDSKSGYAGNMQLNVTDATISSANGYSVQEVLTDSPESSTIAMQITGGKYKGARGTIVTSKHFGESTPTHWAMNAIEGGKYAYAPSTIADGYKVVFNTDADKNEYPYTIVVDDLAPASTIEIAENTTVDEVVNVAENTGIVVKSGVTYTVKGLVIGTGEESKSKVTVEPGAKLIVGSNGILNYANNQLVLQADKDNGCAILRFEGTTGIAQPYGKVELYMYAHKEDGLNVWQHIGIPTAEAPVEIAKTAPYMFNIWDLNKGWQYAPQSEVKDPWTGYNSSTNMESAGSKLTFVGQLVGNAAAEYVLAPNNYSCIANSYTDYVGIKGFINQLPASKTDGTVWVYGLSNNGKAGFTLYNESSFDLKPDPGFSPMQAFFIKNVTEDEIQLNIPYGEMGTTKDADASEVNGGVIVLSGGGERAELQIIEKEGLSDGIIDPKYDSEQFDTDMIKIYTEKCGKNLAAIGTNSLEGKEITIVTKAATSYTLSFEYLAGKAFKLTDLASGAEVEVGADKTYTFTAEANSTIKRFKLGEGEVAANEADADGAVSIWTNNGQVFVANNAAEADIEIINLSGVKVASTKASGEAVQAVSISNLASGVYVVRVGNTAAKIVK